MHSISFGITDVNTRNTDYNNDGQIRCPSMHVHFRFEQLTLKREERCDHGIQLSYCFVVINKPSIIDICKQKIGISISTTTKELYTCITLTCLFVQHLQHMYNIMYNIGITYYTTHVQHYVQHICYIMYIKNITTLCTTTLSTTYEQHYVPQHYVQHV